MLLLNVSIIKTFAQESKIRVKGTVLSLEDGEPVIGAVVKLKSNNRSTQTNVNGNFTVDVTPTEKLIISSIGFKTVEIPVDGKTTLDLRLSVEDMSLKEVVVTALGIKREEKALGYATTVVQGEQLTEALSGNWTDALSGKVAGLNLVRSNSGPTGSNKIILRGENNLTGDNEALIVVDGVVINNSSARRTANAGESVYGTSSDNMPADYGSGLNDINPEDIENINILKGPAAAALYGQRGANGAIIITTKSGSTKKKDLVLPLIQTLH